MPLFCVPTKNINKILPKILYIFMCIYNEMFLSTEKQGNPIIRVSITQFKKNPE